MTLVMESDPNQTFNVNITHAANLLPSAQLSGHFESMVDSCSQDLKRCRREKEPWANEQGMTHSKYRCECESTKCDIFIGVLKKPGSNSDLKICEICMYD